MKRAALFLFVLLSAGCDLSAGNRVEDRMRADALSRASADCSAAQSCRVAMKPDGDGWLVTVSPTAIAISGDPQFSSGAVHHYHYDASGTFVSETSD
jgi:hypothetical protein